MWSAAAAAAASFRPGEVLASGPKAGPNEALRVAIVGVKGRGMNHVGDLAGMKDVQVAAIVDIDENIIAPAMKTIEKKGGNKPQYYKDIRKMLEDKSIDAVSIATTNHTHALFAIWSVQAGKHVYVQKSMTTTLVEADEVVRTARQKGLKLCASPGEMLRPPWPQIKEVVEQGLLGRVYWALTGMQSGGHENEGFRHDDDVLSNVDPTWYYKPGGGPVYDMTVYCLHELTGILGPVRRVSAMSGIGLPVREWKGKRIDVEMDDNTLMLLDWGNSTFGHAFGANCRGGPLPRVTGRQSHRALTALSS